MAMSLEEYEAKRKLQAGAGIGIAGNCLGGVASNYQSAVEQIRQQGSNIHGPAGVLGGSTRVTPELTRFDPSTNTRVPVTQEWVDEAVAEIVRLNIELTPMVGEYRADYSAPEQHQIDALNAECRMFLADHGLAAPSEADRIWEAVRAASAV